MIDLNREEFEKLPEIAEKIKRSRLNFSKILNRYLTSTMSDDDQFDCDFVNGAKWAWEYQQKKLDCCREENKAHLEKIDDLQARIDSLTNINESLAAYKNQLLDELEEKGNKDEN